MMVTFVSQCEKKALNRTRRVLDAFADRIGDNTWQTVITQDGLLAVKKLLRKTATKNTAVSCHWIRSRSRSELVWVVGKRNKFDSEGRVPVNYTRNQLLKMERDVSWNHLPAIQILAAIAGLFHDVGKSNPLFQGKLKGKSASSSNKRFEPYRHEWVSLRIFESFAAELSDEQWISKLASVQPKDEKVLIENLYCDYPDRADSLQGSPFKELAPLAKMVAWLIVSHHRLPEYINSAKGFGPPNIDYTEHWLTKEFDWAWNSRNAEYEEFKASDFKKNWQLKNKTPFKSEQWCKKGRELANRAQKTPSLWMADISIKDAFALHISRLSLMLADHVYSGTEPTARWQDPKYDCYANTDRETRALKQKLDEHNIGVANNAYLFASSLPRLKQNLPALSRVRLLESQTNISRFTWQNKAYSLAKELSEVSKKQGFFGVNMASTGTGKTIANARVMHGLADPMLGSRFSIALGLRTLTQQTGDALTEMLGLSDDDIAVMIGSQAVKELHALNSQTVDDKNEMAGSASAESLIKLGQVIRYEGQIYDGRLSAWLKDSPKLLKLLSAPLLVSTIDHLMPATEGKRGGRQIAPMLRLLTSDLVLDEPDDFDQADIPALSRLVNWAGLLGARVLLSSATLPPAIVEGLFDAYRAGRKQYNKACGETGVDTAVCCAWFDETLKPVSKVINNSQSFKPQHQSFVQARSKKLEAQEKKRKAELLAVEPLSANASDVIGAMSQSIINGMVQLHQQNAITHKPTAKKVSLGLVRMANINPMVAVAQNILAQAPQEDYRIHFCIYHSRHPMIVRSQLEKTLDETLSRSDQEKLWQVKEIKNALEKCPEKNQIFVVFGTAVTEVGRDHDYDWAIAEPSSMRSLIQLAGRILRHRNRIVEQPNMLILRKNYRALIGESIAYEKPGFESKNFKLASKDLKEILSEHDYQQITALPRMNQPERLEPEQNLVHLEHAQLLECIYGHQEKIKSHASHWWNGDVNWSGEMQRRTPFRQSSPDERLVLFSDDEDEDLQFALDERPKERPLITEIPFTRPKVEIAECVQPWMDLSIKPLLMKLVEQQGKSWQYACRAYTELRVQQGWEGQSMCYVPDYGVYRPLLP